MSGRGLGFTGGTLDKLESIPGYNTQISVEEFIDNVETIGISLIGQTENLAPADKKLYALRDSISCVESIPLIASSIMSKKIASGANKIDSDSDYMLLFEVIIDGEYVNPDTFYNMKLEDLN